MNIYDEITNDGTCLKQNVWWEKKVKTTKTHDRRRDTGNKQPKLSINEATEKKKRRIL